MKWTQHNKETNVCGYCGRRLGVGYYWRCRGCGENYCFIHRDRHVCNATVSPSTKATLIVCPRFLLLSIMPQDIAAKKAWVKIYRRRGQNTKARQLEKEVRRLENPKPTTPGQTQYYLEKKMTKRLGRPLTPKERLHIIHGIWGRKGESVDDTRRRLGHDRNGYYITELFGMSEEEKRRWWRRHPNR